MGIFVKLYLWNVLDSCNYCNLKILTKITAHFMQISQALRQQ